MQFLDKQRSMILNDFATVSITSLSPIMAQSTRCITYSVRFLRFVDLRIGCDMPIAYVIKYFHQMISLNNFHDMESSIESWRSSSTNYNLFDRYTFSVCACSATV